MDRSRLDATRRDTTVRALSAREFDVLVVGGGVIGCGIALDATARGLRTALIEAQDLAGGTSSRSGKVVQGVLRFPERVDAGLVGETLRERDLQTERLAPHLARAEPFLVPVRGGWQRGRVGALAAFHDVVRAGTRRRAGVPRHAHLGRRRALSEAPALRSDGLGGAVRYHDVSFDDARHTMALARTAAGLGATVATRMRAVGMLHRAGRVRGVRAYDAVRGIQLEIQAGVVVNATGVRADRLQGMAGAQRISVTPVKGVHLIVPGDAIEAGANLMIRGADEDLLVRRWCGHWLVGTPDSVTGRDRTEPGIVDERTEAWQPAVSRQDIDRVLSQLNPWLRRPIGHRDVLATYAGLRPVVPVGPANQHAQPFRGRVIVEDPPGLITVVGGTYPAYRPIAAEAVDLATWRLRVNLPASGTDRLPIHGAVGVDGIAARASTLAAETGVSAEWIRFLTRRYGSAVSELLDLIGARPDLGAPLPGTNALAAEVVHAARSEGALGLEDVLVRRTHVMVESRDADSRAAAVAVRLLGSELGWDEAEMRAELESYRERVRADRARWQLDPGEDPPGDARRLRGVTGPGSA